MTDNEIIKALECCFLSECDCKDCPYRDFEICDTAKMINTVIDLFNRRQEEREALIAGQETLQKHIAEQKAEIERYLHSNRLLERDVKAAREEIENLTIACDNFETALKTLKKIEENAIKSLKSEAIKEFAERLKKRTYPFPCAIGVENAVTIRGINDIVKEMVGADDA